MSRSRPASEMQSLMAVRIARSVGAQILRAESQLLLPVSPEAGHFVILGRYHLMGEWNLEHGRQFLRSAVQAYERLGMDRQAQAIEAALKLLP